VLLLQCDSDINLDHLIKLTAECIRGMNSIYIGSVYHRDNDQTWQLDDMKFREQSKDE